MGTKGFPHFTLCYPLPKEGTESWHTGLGLSTEQGPSEGNNKSKQAKGGMAKEANLTDCLVYPHLDGTCSLLTGGPMMDQKNALVREEQRHPAASV